MCVMMKKMHQQQKKCRLNAFCVSPSINSTFLEQVLLCVTGLHWKNLTAFAHIELIICGWTLSLSLFHTAIQAVWLWHRIDSQFIGIHENRQMRIFICQTSLFAAWWNTFMNMNIKTWARTSRSIWILGASMWNKQLWHQYIYIYNGVEQFTENTNNDEFVAALLHDVMLEYFTQTRRNSLESV